MIFLLRAHVRSSGAIASAAAALEPAYAAALPEVAESGGDPLPQAAALSHVPAGPAALAGFHRGAGRAPAAIVASAHCSTAHRALSFGTAAISSRHIISLLLIDHLCVLPLVLTPVFFLSPGQFAQNPACV